MEFHVQLPTTRIDVGAIEEGLMEIDPAALADLDRDGTLRVATSVEEREIAGVLSGLGLPVAPQAILRQPSVCCGSCSG